MEALLEATHIHLPGVLHDLSLNLMSQEVLQIQGPSGSGKSSILRSLVRATPHHQADIELEGKSINSDNVTWYRSRVHYVSQLLLAPDVSVEEFLASPFCFRNYKDKHFDLKQARELLNRFGLDHIQPQTSIRTLSGGELQRTCLVRSLLLRPQILLLDEPLSALDPQTADKTLKELMHIHSSQNSNWGVILISHAQLPETFSFSEKAIERGKWKA